MAKKTIFLLCECLYESIKEKQLVTKACVTFFWAILKRLNRRFRCNQDIYGGPVWRHFKLYHFTLSWRKGGSQLNIAPRSLCRLFLSRSSQMTMARTSCQIGFVDFRKPTTATFDKPCHLSQWVWRAFARSSSCILSRRSCGLTCSSVVTPHIQRIISRSLRCRRCRSYKAGAQVSLAWWWWEMSGR